VIALLWLYILLGLYAAHVEHNMPVAIGCFVIGHIWAVAYLIRERRA
jgi:uncharacterized membrane protein (DUF485 family)